MKSYERNPNSAGRAFGAHRIHGVRLPLAFALAFGCLSLSPHAAAQPVLVTNLYTFQGLPDGSDPIALIYGAGGVLYGTTFVGGANDTGTIFKTNPGGTGEQVLHSFRTIPRPSRYRHRLPSIVSLANDMAGAKALKEFERNPRLPTSPG